MKNGMYNTQGIITFKSFQIVCGLRSRESGVHHRNLLTDLKHTCLRTGLPPPFRFSFGIFNKLSLNELLTIYTVYKFVRPDHINSGMQIARGLGG